MTLPSCSILRMVNLTFRFLLNSNFTSTETARRAVEGLFTLPSWTDMMPMRIDSPRHWCIATSLQ